MTITLWYEHFQEDKSDQIIMWMKILELIKCIWEKCKLISQAQFICEITADCKTELKKKKVRKLTQL